MVFNPKPSNDDFYVRAGIKKLLQPFADEFSETIEQITQELSGNASYSQLGQVLLEVIQHKFAEQEQTAKAALHDTQAQLTESRQEVTRLTKTLDEKEALLEQLQADEDTEIKSLQATVHTQNRILARQQKKLQRLLGAMEQDSEVRA